MSNNISPTRMAWRRLLKNKLAVVSLILLGLMILSVVILPEVLPIDPIEARPWLKHLPPGSKAPSVSSLNEFYVGQKPIANKRILKANELIFELKKSVESEIQIKTKKGKVRKITRISTGEPLNNIDLDGKSASIKIEDEELTHLKVKKGETLPDYLPQNQKTIIVQVLQENREQGRIEIEDGIARRIQIGEKSLNEFVLKGEEVLSMSIDGEDQWNTFWFGSDDLGRDLLGRVMMGGRISLLIGLVATCVSVFIGVLIGALSGYLGGWVDRLITGGIDILYAIPFMFLVILLLVSFGRNIIMLFIALGAVQWLTMARIVRAQVMSLKEKEFIEAAQLTGSGPMNIIFKHLIPNSIGPIIVYSTLLVPIVILEESFLAYIGLQVQFNDEALDSWGALVEKGVRYTHLATGDKAWELIFPALAMSITLFCLNSVGDGLRDAFDPRLDKG